VELNKKVTESLNNTSHQPIRNSVRRTIYEALLNKEEVEGNISPYIIENILKKIKNLSIEIEGTLFNELFRSEDKGTKYLVRVKAIASNLQDKKNLDFRTAVIEGSFTPKEITLMDVKKMASSELQSKRLMAEKDSFNSLRLDWHDVHAPVGVGMYTCEKCKGQRTTSKEIQLRGADEPMTL
jgi:DNA-directed RNA polymerase subunit M/transcription elongation factor TFIIS